MPSHRDVPTIVTRFDLRDLSRVGDAARAMREGRARLVGIQPGEARALVEARRATQARQARG